jgi:hypothetical protein
MYAKSGWFEPSGSTYPAIVVQADGTLGDIAAANNGTIQLGGTTLTDEDDTSGSFVSRATISSTLFTSKIPLRVEGALTVTTGGASISGGLTGSSGISFTGASTIAGVGLSSGDVTADILIAEGVIPVNAPTSITTVSDATSSSARWHQPASGAKYELKRSSSSERYKNTIEYPDPDFLDVARKIQPRFFRRNDETSGRRHLGFIAEEVYSAGLGEAVTYWDPGDGPLIDGVEVTALLASAILRIKDLETRLAELEG